MSAFRRLVDSRVLVECNGCAIPTLLLTGHMSDVNISTGRTNLLLLVVAIVGEGYFYACGFLLLEQS